MPGQDHRCLVASLRLIGERGWDRRLGRGVARDRQVGRERRGLLDQALIKLDPFGLIERDSGHRLPIFAIDRDKARLGGRTLGDDHLVGSGGNTHRFDIDPELAGPECRDGDMRAALGGRADHIMRGNVGLLHGVAPMFQRHELVVVQRMWEPRHVSGDKDVIGDDGVNVEDAAACVTGDPKRARRQIGIFQPFRIADGS